MQWFSTEGGNLDTARGEYRDDYNITTDNGLGEKKNHYRLPLKFVSLVTFSKKIFIKCMVSKI